MHLGRNYTGVAYEPGVGVEAALTLGPLRTPPNWVNLDLLRDFWRSPPPHSDCTSRGILAFALLAFTGRPPWLPRGFRHQHPGLSLRRDRMKSESRGGQAEGAAERAACLLLLNPQWPRGLSPHSEAASSTFSSSPVPRRPPQPRRPFRCRPRALWLRGPGAPSAAGPRPPHLPRSAPPAGPPA